MCHLRKIWVFLSPGELGQDWIWNIFLVRLELSWELMGIFFKLCYNWFRFVSRNTSEDSAFFVGDRWILTRANSFSDPVACLTFRAYRIPVYPSPKKTCSPKCFCFWILGMFHHFPKKCLYNRKVSVPFFSPRQQLEPFNFQEPSSCDGCMHCLQGPKKNSLGDDGCDRITLW